MPTAYILQLLTFCFVLSITCLFYLSFQLISDAFQDQWQMLLHVNYGLLLFAL